VALINNDKNNYQEREDNMFNFKIIKAEGFEDLEKNETEKLPENAVMLKEGSKLEDVLFKGFILVLPVLLLMIALAYKRCRSISGSISLNRDSLIAAAAGILACVLLSDIHEIIHGIFLPLRAKKIFYKLKKAKCIYCSARLSKTRSVAVNLAPFVLLSVIPFALWMKYGYMLPTEFMLVSVIVIWLMCLICMGDFANTFNIIKQVPRGCKVMNHGYHTYYIKTGKDKK